MEEQKCASRHACAGAHRARPHETMQVLEPSGLRTADAGGFDAHHHENVAHEMAEGSECAVVAAGSAIHAQERPGEAGQAPRLRTNGLDEREKRKKKEGGLGAR